ncbi:hypothetical protein ACNKHW_15015 [Shigella flexneri]
MPDSLFWLVKRSEALRSMKHLNTIRQRHLSLQSSALAGAFLLSFRV